jgi:hypothetical protein
MVKWPNLGIKIIIDMKMYFSDMGESQDCSPIIPLRGAPLSPPKSPTCPFSPPVQEELPPEVPPPPKSPPLKLGDRVVWLSDSGPEHGTVRWLGVLPGANASPHTMAGVEFVSTVKLLL